MNIDDALWIEAIDRMELMGVSLQDINNIQMHRTVGFKVVVNDEKKTIRKMPVIDKEREMIRQLEDEYGFVCYYLSKDEKIRLGDEECDRYTLFYVSNHPYEFDMIKETMENYRAVPAYVVNLKMPEYSELCECEYENVKGLVINIS